MFPDYNATFESVPGRGRGEEIMVRTTLPPAGKDYPTLYLRMTFLADPKTHRVNPATVKRDVRLRVKPHDHYEPSNDFNAPHDELELHAVNEIVTFEFIYTVDIRGSSVKVSGGYKEVISAEKDVTITEPRRGMVRIKGELNTVQRNITASCYRM